MAAPDPNPDRTERAAPAAGAAATGGGADTLGGPPAARPDRVPAVIAGYRVRAEVGRGGMGVVYRAEDGRLKREVAIKLMLPQLAANPQAKARFLREARAQARVEHDHVAAIHLIGEHGGLPYLVMPLLKGMTLQAALKANPKPPLAEVVRIAREMAEGLAAAHEQGLVHRDVKPANVWLEGKRLRVKVLDFGLARAVSEPAAAGSDADPVTTEGTLVGTPSYMSPEQARGLPVDGRTDLWSLGVILYQMTTGELPFRGPTALAVLTALGLDDPPPPMALNPSVPPAVSDLVMRLLSKDAAGRPPTAEAVAEELRQIELGLAAGVRVVALDSVPGAAPPAPAGPDPFADLGATEANTLIGSTERAGGTAARAAGVGARRSRQRGGLPAWTYAAAAVLAVAGVVGLVVSQPGKKPPPEPAQHEEPKPGPQPPAARPKDKPLPFGEADRKAAEALRPHARFVVRFASGQTAQVDTPDAPLPPEPFELTTIAFRGGEPLGANALLPLLSGLKALDTFDDSGVRVRLSDDDFARLVACPFWGNLTYLIADFELTTKAVASLKHCPRLTHLGCRAGQADDDTLAKLAELRGLTTLAFWDIGLSGKVGEKGWRAVTGLPVTYFSLRNARPDPRAWELIGRMPGLADLRLSDCVTAGEAELRELARAKNLAFLSLYRCGVPDAALGHLTGLGRLAQLDLRGCPVSDAGLIRLRPPALRALDLGGTKVTEAGVKALQAALPHCTVTLDGATFEAADVHYREANRLLSRGGFEISVQTPDGQEVKTTTADDLPDGPFTLLGFSRVNRDAFGDEDLKRLEATPTLRWFIAPGLTVSPAGLRSLAASRKTLGVLYLAQSPLTDDHFKVIGELEALGSAHLGADGSKVTDAGIAHLAGLTRLNTLVLHGTGLTDAGLAALAGMAKMESLQLDETRITDAGLGTVARFPLLRELTLTGTAVSDAGIDTLAGVKGLRTLNLTGTRVTEAGLKKLRAALPGCKITWEDPNASVARSLLSRGGYELVVRTPDGKQLAVKRAEDLPTGPFLVITLAKNAAGTTFNDTDLRMLAPLAELTAVYVHGNQLTDAGLRPLARLKDTLTDLNLAHGPFGDEGAKVLAELANLRSLSLGGTKITEAGVDKLAAALPKCRITWDGGTIEPAKKP